MRCGHDLMSEERKPLYGMHIRKLWLQQETFPSRHLYPFNLEIFRQTPSLEFSKPVTFFVGENGSGKSTLLKAVARKCGIHIWEDQPRRRYHVNPCEDLLHRHIRIDGDEVEGSFFASEIFRHFAEVLDEWAAADPASLEYFGKSSLMEQSHGQSHMAFFSNRFRIRGLYLLDEPENALSPRMQIDSSPDAPEICGRWRGPVHHRHPFPILLACPDSDIFSFNHVPIRKVDYESTDYYRIYKDFLDNRQKYLD